MPLLFQGVQGSTLVECPKGKNCEDKCGENILFSLGNQESNKCRYFKPSELVRVARETYKLDRVDWLCHNNHKVKGVSEGEAQPCSICDQTLYDRMEQFLTRRLREVSRDIGEGYDFNYRVNRDTAPPAVKYTVFIADLFSSHGIKGQGLMHPEAVSAKRKCLVQCSQPSIDLKSGFPDFTSSDFHVHKVFQLMKFLMNTTLDGFTQGVFKREFGIKNLQQYLWCETYLKVKQQPSLWLESWELVPLKVWNCSSLCIRGKLENLVEKAKKIKEESKLLSVVMDWLEYDELAITPAFGDLTQAKARQLEPSKQRIRTGGIARDASLENCVNNLNLSPSDGPRTITGDELWRQHGPQTLTEAFEFFGRVVKMQAEGKISTKRAVQQTLIETTRPKLIELGIKEYTLSHPPLNDDEEDRQGSNTGGHGQNPRSNSKASRGRGGKLRGNSKRSREMSTNSDPSQTQRSQRPRTNSNGSRRGSRNDSRNESKRRSSRSSNSNQDRSRDRRGRSPPRDDRCRRCDRSVRESERFCSSCGHPNDRRRR